MKAETRTRRTLELIRQFHDEALPPHVREAARWEVVELNTPLVRLYVRRMRRNAGTSVGNDDLVQEGLLGLYRSVERFDLAQGSTFGTYSLYWVRNAVLTALQSAYGRRIPRYAHVGWNKFYKWASRHGLMPHDRVVQEAFCDGWPEIKRDAFLRIAEAITRVSYSVENMANVLASNHNSFGEVDTRDEWEAVEKRLQQIPARDQNVVRTYFGLNGRVPKIGREIAQELGMSNSGVTKIIRKCVQELAG